MIKITDKSKCTGCHACTTICPKSCISMCIDEEGFWYPLVEEANCVNCGACVRACPILTPLDDKKTDEDVTAYAVIHKDAFIREKSSSGGVFTAIATYVIMHGGVVFGAAFDDHFQVVHRYVETVEDLKELRGSKYVQSEIGDSYRLAESFLKHGRQVLFSGTPCQIEGLFAYLGENYENLLTQDIICHGVPSPMVWEQYKQWQTAKAGAEINSIFFRDKKKGWKRYSMMIKYVNNKEYVMPLNKDPFLQAFIKNLCLRPSCYDCSFKKMYRLSDFTLADFWGIENVLPHCMDDGGVSLVLVNSPKAQNIFSQIKDFMVVEKVDMGLAVKHNSAFTHSVPMEAKRASFIQAVKTEDFKKVKKRFLKPSLLQTIIRMCKRLIRRLLKLDGKKKGKPL